MFGFGYDMVCVWFGEVVVFQYFALKSLFSSVLNDQLILNGGLLILIQIKKKKKMGAGCLVDI